MRSMRKKSLFFGIVLIMMGLGLGYAFLTTNLMIDGTAEIDSSNWNVYWSGIYYDGTVALPQDQIIQEPTINSQKNKVSFQVRFKEPGEGYAFGVTAKNDGTMDAEIDSIQALVNGLDTSHLPPYLEYEILYNYFSSVEEGQILKAGETANYTVYVHYRTDINPEDLPDSDESYTFSFGVTYVQAETNIEENGEKVFTASNGDSVRIGSKIPQEVETFSDYASAISSFGYPVFLRHTLTHRNLVYSTYAGFEKNGNVYYFQGGDGGASFTDNKILLSSIFDSSHCDIAGYYMECMDGTNQISCDDSGNVTVARIYDDTYASCHIDSSGNSYCGAEPYNWGGD